MTTKETANFYFNKVKERLADMVENQGLKKLHIDWGEEAFKMTLEERCKWWLEFMDDLENGSIHTEVLEPGMENLPEWYAPKERMSVDDWIIRFEQDAMLNNHNMDS